MNLIINMYTINNANTSMNLRESEMVNTVGFISKIKERKLEIEKDSSKIYEKLRSRIKKIDLLNIYNFLIENQLNLKALDTQSCVRFAKEQTKLSRTFDVVKQEDGELALILQTKRKGINKDNEDYRGLTTFRKVHGAYKSCKDSWRIDMPDPLPYVTLVLKTRQNALKHKEEARKEARISQAIQSKFTIKNYLGETFNKPTYGSPYIIDISDYTEDKLGIFRGVKEEDDIDEIEEKLDDNFENHEAGKMVPLIIRFKDKDNKFIYCLQTYEERPEIIHEKHDQYYEIHKICSEKLDFKSNRDIMPYKRSLLSQHDISSICRRGKLSKQNKITTKTNFFCEKADYSLSELIRKEILTINQKDKIFKDIMLGLKDMHSQDISHGDLGTQNVFIFKEKNGAYTAKLGDFGRSEENCSQDHKNRDFGRISRWMENLYSENEINERLNMFNLGPLLSMSDPDDLDYLKKNERMLLIFLNKYQQLISDNIQPFDFKHDQNSTELNSRDKINRPRNF